MSSCLLALIYVSTFLLSLGSAYPDLEHGILIQKPVAAQHRAKVPGRNPAFHCDDPAKDVFQIRSMDIEPDPPQPGYYLGVEALGTFTEGPGRNLTYLMNASMNGEQYLWNRRPLCELVNTMQDGKGECPPKKGRVSMSAWVPVWFLPAGYHTVRLEGLTQNNTRLFCLIATVKFNDIQQGIAR